MDASLPMIALAGQTLAYAGQALYLFAFPRAFARQARALRRRPLACFAVGFGCAAAWLALGAGLSKITALAGFSFMLVSGPMVVAGIAGGAVALTCLMGLLLRREPERHAYLCLAAGQPLALACLMLPGVGIMAAAVWTSCGLGAIALSYRADGIASAP